MPEPKSPVVPGLEEHEVVYAKNQPEYIPLPTLKSPDGKVMSRWRFSDEERRLIAEGADLFLTLWTFNQPLQPIMVEVYREANPDYFRERMRLPRAEPPKHRVTFRPSGRGQARCAPDPNYPDGIALDCREDPALPSCKIDLPYPAPECGVWMVECARCDLRLAVTAAGRADDPISVRVTCRPKADTAQPPDGGGASKT